MDKTQFNGRSYVVAIFLKLLIITFPSKIESQGSFIINQVFHDADEWVIKETYLGHRLSGDLLNSPGGATEYGTELGNYVHRADLDGSSGICVKLSKNGSWRKIRCTGPKSEKLVDGAGNGDTNSVINYAFQDNYHILHTML